jgi:hypothetical protein
MRAWIIVGLLSVTVCQPFQQRQGAHTPKEQQKVTNQAPPPTVSPSPSPNCQPAPNPNQSKSENKTSNWKDAFAPPTWSNWALVLVGLGATIAALLTLSQIRRQARSMRYQTTHLKNSVIQSRKAADATKASAEAALLGAQAVIDSDRAWLLISQLHSIQTSWKLEQTYYRCFVDFKNFGKTPAKIVALSAEIQIGNTRDNPDDPSIYNSRIQSVVPEMVAQGESAPQVADCKIPITTEQTNGIRDKRYFLWLCGLVRYEDVFRGEPWHETRFCYLWEDRDDGSGPRWHMAGPSEYNGATDHHNS